MPATDSVIPTFPMDSVIATLLERLNELDPDRPDPFLPGETDKTYGLDALYGDWVDIIPSIRKENELGLVPFVVENNVHMDAYENLPEDVLEKALPVLRALEWIEDSCWARDELEEIHGTFREFARLLQWSQS